MGIEPFLIAYAINVIVAQRLVRNICQKCRTSYSVTPEEKNIIESSSELKKVFKDKDKKINTLRLYKGTGCKVCNFSGYSGRLGIFEVLEVNEEIREAILRKASKDEIMKIAIKNGMTTILQDGMEKVFNGLTTFEEVIRVSRG